MREAETKLKAWADGTLRDNFLPHQSLNHSIRNPCLHMLGIVTIREIIGELIDKRLLHMGKIDEWIIQ